MGRAGSSRHGRTVALVVVLVATAALLAGSSARPTMPTAGIAEAAGADPVLLAAGDISSCTSNADEATATILDAQQGEIASLGDHAYEDGTAAEFTNCYGPTWGRHKGRTHPAPGNHEYRTPDAAGYFGYFGAAAGTPGKGWYSYDLGTWHVVVLNSNCAPIGGCGAGSPQEIWLRADLASHPSRCTLAYWHQPRFSSGLHGSDTTFQPFWQALYDAGADVVLNAHDHQYERFAPQTPTGAAAPGRGIREFVVGTGGASLHAPSANIIANSEVRGSSVHGILRLVLHSGSYDWSYLPVAGDTFTDSGSGSCYSTITPETTIGGGPSGTTKDATATVTFSSDQSDGSFECALDGGAWTTCSSPRTVGPVGDGAHVFAVRAVDGSGNRDPTPATASWTVDTTPPAAPTISGGPQSTQATPSAVFSWTNSEPGGSNHCALDGAPAVACTSPTTLTGLGEGQHRFSISQTDGVGNEGSPATRSWTVAFPLAVAPVIHSIGRVTTSRTQASRAFGVRATVHVDRPSTVTVRLRDRATGRLLPLRIGSTFRVGRSTRAATSLRTHTTGAAALPFLLSVALRKGLTSHRVSIEVIASSGSGRATLRVDVQKALPAP